MKFLIFVTLIAAAHCQKGYEQQKQVQQEEEGAAGPNVVDASVPEPPSQIPETSFVCEGKPYDPGMYADEETGCRVYHMCFRGRKEDFICGTGTIFSQETLTCDYPQNVDCAASPSFYNSNEGFGVGAPEPAGDQGAKPARRGPRPTEGGRGISQRPAQEEYDEQPAQRPARTQPPSKAQPPRRQQPRPTQQTKVNRRPATQARPVVQQRQQLQEDVDNQYEPQASNQQFSRRSGLIANPSVGRRAMRASSQRWQIMMPAN